MSAEIRFPMTDAPHYLTTLVFSRGGEAVNVEVVDERNQQKALCTIPLDKFREAMAFLGCVKVIEGESVIKLKEF